MKKTVKNLITWSPSHLITSQKSAFTLAEVLITLAIIGVVAAMTIPTLTANYNKKVIETRLAKFYSIMNNAIALSEIDNGPKENWNFVEQKVDENNEYISQLDDNNKFFSKYIIPYLKIVHTENATFKGMDVLLYYFADGSAFCITYVDSHHIYYFPKKPNEKTLNNGDTENGTTHFAFAFKPIATTAIYKYHENLGIEPYKFQWDGNNESLVTGSIYSCDNSGMYCTALIQANSWEIPDNYPRSFK